MYAKMTKHAAMESAYLQDRFKRILRTAVVVASLVNLQKHAALVLALMLRVPTHRTAELADGLVRLAKYARMDFVKTLVR